MEVSFEICGVFVMCVGRSSVRGLRKCHVFRKVACETIKAGNDWLKRYGDLCVLGRP